MPKTATAPYTARTAQLWKAPAYKLRLFTIPAGVPAGTEYTFSRDFVTTTLQAQTGNKLVCLDAPQGSAQTIVPELGQSSIGSFTFPLYDRDGEITRQIADPQVLLGVGMSNLDPPDGGAITAASSIAGYPDRGTIRIDNESIGYTGLDLAAHQFLGIDRGARGSINAVHAVGAIVHNAERLDLATRVQLSAGYTDIDEADFCAFAKMEVADIRLDADLSTYLVVATDIQRFLKGTLFITATPDAPATMSANPIDLVLMLSLTSETPGKNHAAYDLGDGTGLDLPQALMDVVGLEALRDAEFPTDVYQFIAKGPETAKNFFEAEIWKTLTCVPWITPEGKYSALRLTTTGTPTETITDEDVIRITGWRKGTDRVINVLDFQYDFDLESNPDSFSRRRIYLMDNSIALYGRRPSLVISSRCIQSGLGGDDIADKLAQRVADRWAGPPPILELDLFYTKHLLEAGDRVAVTLSAAPNIMTGVRGIAGETFEVQDVRPIFEPTAQAGVHVTLVWLGAVELPAPPSKTTKTITRQASATGEDTAFDGTETELCQFTASVTGRETTLWGKCNLDGEWDAGGGTADVELRIYRDAVLLGSANARMAGTGSTDTGQRSLLAIAIETPAAGSYTWSLRAIRTTESGVVSTTATGILLKGIEAR